MCNTTAVVRDGAEALDYLFSREKEALLTVVLLDLQLPKIDGLEVLRRIRAKPETKLLPVVILTSSDEQENIVKSHQLGDNSFVAKPLEMAKCSEAVARLRLYWMVINRVPGR